VNVDLSPHTDLVCLSMRPRQTPSKSAQAIICSTQQTRFFDPNETEVDLVGLTIAVGDRELLCDTRLKLKSGTRYALVGRNGSGKSSEQSSLLEAVLYLPS